MAFSKITSKELVDKGVAGLPDVPGMSTTDMQKKFDEIPKDVIIPKFNKLIEDMESENGSQSMGMRVPEGIESDPNAQAVVDQLAKKTIENENKKHQHENKNILDMITATVKEGYDRLVTLFKDIESISDTVNDSSSSLPTGKAIVAYMKKMGGGDMATSVYDTNESGVVDNAEKLGGELPSAYQRTTSQELETESKEIVGAINEVFKMSPDTIDPKNATRPGVAADALATKNALTEQNNKIVDIEQSFTDGCNTIVGGCTAYGVTPKSNSPADIVTAIGQIRQKGYASGHFSYDGVHTIDIGFKPSFVAVSCRKHSDTNLSFNITKNSIVEIMGLYNGSSQSDKYVNVDSDYITITNTGFTLNKLVSGSLKTCPCYYYAIE